MSTLQANEYVPFEQIKHASEDGYEFWFARELSLVLEYAQWRNFAKVLDRAKIACMNSGYQLGDHFAEVSKIVAAGAASKPIVDYKLTRYACYLIVQNGDPRKGKEVRGTIERVGGTMPEDMPIPQKSITEVEREQLRKLKKDSKKLMLDE
jgi:hypothetical protein